MNLYNNNLTTKIAKNTFFFKEKQRYITQTPNFGKSHTNFYFLFFKTCSFEPKNLILKIKYLPEQAVFFYIFISARIPNRLIVFAITRYMQLLNSVLNAIYFHVSYFHVPRGQQFLQFGRVCTLKYIKISVYYLDVV